MGLLIREGQQVYALHAAYPRTVYKPFAIVLSEYAHCEGFIWLKLRSNMAELVTRELSRMPISTLPTPELIAASQPAP